MADREEGHGAPSTHSETHHDRNARILAMRDAGQLEEFIEREIDSLIK
jgi:hypothetical protein